MPKLLIESIVVTDRARVELGDTYEELKQSIEKRGLFHPIIIDRKTLELVSGFRRLSCHKDLKLKEIDVKYFEDLTNLDKRIIELEENIHEPLTWDEKRALRVQIHKLYQEQHGKAIRGHDSEGWGIKETAEALGVSQATISQDHALTEAIAFLPDIKKIGSRRQALKAIDKAKEISILTELARRESIRDTRGMLPYVLHCGDAVKIIKNNVDNETIDLVVFDPPWGIDIHRIASSRGPRGEKTSYKDDTETTAIDLTLNILPELHRVMREDAHMYMFIGMQYKDFYIDLLAKFQKSIEMAEIIASNFPGLRKAYNNLLTQLNVYAEQIPYFFHVEEIPLIWVKEGGGFTDFEYKFMPRYETILFCSKGKPKPLNEVSSNVFIINRPLTTERSHTQEKPVDLIDRFIKISTQPNQIVLDPCAGSFVTAMAATLSRRRSISIDNDKDCYAKGLARLSGWMAEDDEDEDEDEKGD